MVTQRLFSAGLRLITKSQLNLEPAAQTTLSGPYSRPEIHALRARPLLREPVPVLFLQPLHL